MIVQDHRGCANTMTVEKESVANLTIKDISTRLVKRSSGRQNRTWALKVSDRPLEDGDLRRGIAGGFEFRANLFFQIGGIADLVEQDIKEAFGGQEAVSLKFFDRLITDRYVGAADVENKIVMSVFSNPLES